MHLLDTTTKELKTFYGEIPYYAILSHMWGAEKDEVLFRHVAGSDEDRREGKMRKGYAKIEGACKQAAEDGWKYIWIDTCCIDKASSAELSEAINSMYGWYHNSEVCYVYLEDVQINGDGQYEMDEDATFPIVPFGRSRWFSRGWTLQELIAPRYLVFFSKDWVDVGTKASLRDTISAVTRIRVDMLIAYDSGKASVAEKMSWAAFRETTRAEDVAYCLMGLLGVNMPLLYGEGNRAFRRLQEEFMKVSDDDSLFAWKNSLFDYDCPDNPQGMLAGSPWEFRDGMNIVRSDDGAYSPYSMTNQGLKIKLPLLPVDPKQDLIGIDSENIFKATLKCTIRTQQVVIYLKEIREGYYQRMFSHWLDETGIHPKNTGLTSLVVPQINTSSMTHTYDFSKIKVDIVQTESELTTYSPSSRYGGLETICFQHQEKCFTLVIGLDKGVPWLDLTDFNIGPRSKWQRKIELDMSYMKGGIRYNAVMRHLDHLSEKIPGEDWSLTVSLRKAGRGQDCPYVRAVIGIQRAPIRVISSLMPTGDKFSNDFTSYSNYHSIHPDFKKEKPNWFAVFNPKVKRVLDIGLVYSLPHKKSICCVQFSPDGKYLATGSDMVRVYNMETGAETCLNDGNASILCVCFSPDSRFLATGNALGHVKLWDIDEKRIHKVFDGHRNAATSLNFSLDAHFLISGSKNGIFRIWKVIDETSRILHLSPGSDHVTSTISPNGRLVANRSSAGVIRIWDIATTQQLLEHHENVGLGCVTFTPDGKGLIVGGTINTLKYWDISELVPDGIKGDVERSSMLHVNKTSLRITPTFAAAHEPPIISATVSHDGRWIVFGLLYGDVVFWDLRNATAQLVLKMGRESVRDMSSVGNMFATINDRRVRVWRYDDI